MEKCYNHPDRNAYSICRSCGRNFCKECLTAGIDYYFCKTPECQAALRGALTVCPNCQSELSISFDEQEAGRFRCPECDSFIVFLDGKPEVLPDKNYVRLLSSLNQGDIALIKSLLDDAGVDYYVTGENFLSIRPLVEPAFFFVNEEDLETAKEILKDFELHPFGFSTNNAEEE